MQEKYDSESKQAEIELQHIEIEKQNAEVEHQTKDLVWYWSRISFNSVFCCIQRISPKERSKRNYYPSEK